MTRTVIAKCLRISTVVALVTMSFVAPANAELVQLVSDASWTYSSGPAGFPLSALPFTAADFAAAMSGPNAVVVPPYGGFWLPQLSCDDRAVWISVDANWGPATTMFAHEFNVQTCCIGQAYLSFCWVADDYLGDPAGMGPNPAGVYLNGTPIPALSGGNYATETGLSIDVTGLLHCGANEIHVYDRDGGATVSGAMFWAQLTITECTVHTQPSTWGQIKALYQ